eukprot:CAMPEP_0204842962 /NCGR_PEP_ID=MMETSP1346-20131115/47697_1 /ASSEMBLY_ACC=CAM_ASM_000771 /TAXON_ID=215587 /ORGANISM="Aplanochytrium stocchinoi, Strain GSBS06" /LENGTH=101 /DNA_ID=CAMNT_0051982019 /DNA_START=488 /DNA_END=793 /DNA_ORIENTATION=+
MSNYFVHIQDVVGKQESQEQQDGAGDCPECQEEPCWAERFCSIYLSDNQKEKARKKYPEDPEKVPLPKCILNKVRNELIIFSNLKKLFEPPCYERVFIEAI